MNKKHKQIGLGKIEIEFGKKKRYNRNGVKNEIVKVEIMRDKEGLKKKKYRIEHWHMINVFMWIYDMVAVNLAYFLALWLRFDCKMSELPDYYIKGFLYFAPIYSLCCFLIFARARLYRSIWRFASYSELIRVVMATAATFVIQLAGSILMMNSHRWFGIGPAFSTGRMPLSYYIFGIILQFVFVLGIRFSYRFVLLLRNMREKRVSEDTATNVMIIGAGSAGRMILQELMKSNEINTKVCCFIDDNPNKWNRYIEGVPIVGNRDEILSAAKKYHIDQILVAIPTATTENKRDLLNICKETGCELKSLPGIYQLVNGEVNVAAMKKVTIEDLLGRPPIQADMEQVYEFLNGKKVLITGAGGSIGSVAAMQVAGHQPKQLVLFDMYENNIYDVEH